MRQLPFRPGTLIGNYRIVGPLGQGSGTLVFKVRRVGAPDFYALKIISEILDPSVRAQVLQRLQREFVAIQGLDHPNIIRVVDCILDDPANPYQYIVTEYIDGRPLNDYQQKMTDTQQVLNIMLQCANALEYSHSKHVIHGDIAPKNILIFVDREGSSQVKIIDFGLAKVPKEVRALTGGSSKIETGTEAFSAPERLIQSEPATEYTDIYSLGLLLYQLLNRGQLPFREGEDGARAYYNSGVLIPLPNTEWLQPKKAAEALALVAMKASARRPSLRYTTMAAMRTALEKIRTGHVRNNPIWNQRVEALSINLLSVPISAVITYTIQQLNPGLRSYFNWFIWLFTFAALTFGIWNLISFYLTALPMRRTLGLGSCVIALLLMVAGVFSGGQLVNPIFGDPTQEPVSPTETLVTAVSAALTTVPTAMTTAPTSTPTLEPTALPTQEPTVEPTSLPTTAPTNTPTPEPTTAPTEAPTPTPLPTKGEDLGDTSLSVILVDHRFLPANDTNNGSIWLKMKITNQADQTMQLSYDLLSIVGIDSEGTRYAEYWHEVKEMRAAGFCDPLGASGDVNISPEFSLGPGRSDTTDASFYEGRFLYLTKDRSYNHRAEGGCDVAFKVGINVDWIDVTIPEITYRLDNGERHTLTNLTWRLRR